MNRRNMTSSRLRGMVVWLPGDVCCFSYTFISASVVSVHGLGSGDHYESGYVSQTVWVMFAIVVSKLVCLSVCACEPATQQYYVLFCVSVVVLTSERSLLDAMHWVTVLLLWVFYNVSHI